MIGAEPGGRGRGAGRIVAWLLVLHAVLVLLTNATTLRFLEPSVSRKTLAAASVIAAAAALLLSRYSFPRSGEERRALVRSHAVPATLLVILALAFGLRVGGIRSGLPQSYPADEYDYVNRALKMMKTGEFNPHRWDHPTLQPYLAVITYTGVYFAGAARGRWSSIADVVEEDLLYWGRFISAVAGTATVLATFFLGRRLFGAGVGLLAAALLAVSPAAVEHSQFNKSDPVIALLVPAALLVILSYLKDGGTGRAIASGALIGLTVAAKYNGAPLLFPFLLSVLLRRGRASFQAPDLYLGIGAAIVAFLAGCPYLLADFPRFLDETGTVVRNYAVVGTEGLVSDSDDNWAYHARYIAGQGMGPVGFLAALAGLGLALYRLDGPLAVFLAFPVLYYSYYSPQRVRFPSNMVPVYPFLAILAAYAVEEGRRALARRWPGARFGRSLAVALLIAVLGPLLAGSLRYNHSVMLPDTGNAAREWIERNLPAGSHVAVELHGPVLDRSRYRVMKESRIVNRGVRNYRAEGVEYLVVSSSSYDRFAPDHRQSRDYQELFAICPLVQEFAAVPGESFGPTIRVLRVLPAAGADPVSTPAAPPGPS